MKRFTKSLLTLALLVLGVSSTNAKIVKQNVTFAAEWYCNAKWDAGSKLFTWGTYVAADSDFPSPAWTFMAVNELTGDISEYTKLVLKLEDFTNAEDEELTIYFKEKKGNTQSMDYVTSAKLIPDANGIAELDLTALDWTNDNNPDEIIDNTNIADVTIYGGARIDEDAVGSVYITEAYLEKTVADDEEPVEEDKQDMTFKAEWYCNAKWDAANNLFTWGTYVADDSTFPSPAWTFMAVNELTGDISGYKKLVLKLEDFTNAEDEELTIYFKENKGNTQSMDYVTSAKLIPDANGIAELDLTTLDWTNDNNPDEIIDKTNIADVTIYGGARIDEAEVGSVYITEAYLVKLDAVEVNVGNAGYVSFCPNKAVALGDVTGYAAAFDGEKIVLTEVTEVPAGEGVIIKAAAGSYKLPVIETAAALAGNQLKVSDGKVKGGETVYVLANGKNGLGFYQLAKGQTLSAGKVYIEITGGGSREFVAISNEATSIAAVKGVKADDAIYNLNGQRVGKTQKGLYIVNGKKVMK